MMTEQEFRETCAEISVVRFLAETVLTCSIAGWSAEERRKELDDLLRIGSEGFVRIKAVDEFDAEEAADIAVLSQERLRQVLERVARRTRTDWTPATAPSEI